MIYNIKLELSHPSVPSPLHLNNLSNILAFTKQKYGGNSW